MTNGFDRLERLFASKRRPSPDRYPNPAANAAQLQGPQFPSPSFIHPKATRMAARDERHLRQASGRSPSVPDILPTHQTSPTTQVDGPLRPKKLPFRSPSFSNRRVDHSAAALRDFQFPPRESTQPFAPFHSSPVQIPQLPSPRCRSPFQVDVPTARLDTPPCSDPEDAGLYLAAPPTKKLPEIPCRAPPTPEETPELGPISDLQLDFADSPALDATDHSISKDLLCDLGESFDQLSLNRSYSQSSIAPSAQLSFCSSTLREPDFNEFLNLSDDDIAESTPESPLLESTVDIEPAVPPMGLAISHSKPSASSLLTLTPPRTSRPATIAAFEAARIARRYDFDLVYVVNLWPDHASATPPSSGLPEISGHGKSMMAKPMMGRLLAAHGLQHVPSPLQISSVVHTTILRSDGWVEYRNLEAQSHDLARGYASAFYTGQYTRAGSPHVTGPVSGVRLSERIDRGIVFAAYRKPRTGGDLLGRELDEAQLGVLHREAEALVEMLIDIHVANRLRQPPTQRSGHDETETGPMPLQDTKPCS